VGQEKRRMRRNPSVTEAQGKFCCGLGVWAVRAGSIGREEQRLGESANPPQGDAGGIGPRPLHEEFSALWFQVDRPDPQAWAPHGLYAGPESVAAGHP
jgi:hypothetical protein